MKDIEPAIATAACLTWSMTPSGAHFDVKFEGNDIIISADNDANARETATLAFSNLSNTITRTVAVSTPDVTITLDKSSASIILGETLQLTASASPDAYGITWTYDCQKVIEFVGLGTSAFAPSFHVSIDYSSPESMWTHQLNVK